MKKPLFVPGISPYKYMYGSQELSKQPAFVKERFKAKIRESLKGLFQRDDHPIHPTLSRWAKVFIRMLPTKAATSTAVLKRDVARWQHLGI